MAQIDWPGKHSDASHPAYFGLSAFLSTLAQLFIDGFEDFVEFLALF